MSYAMTTTHPAPSAPVPGERSIGARLRSRFTRAGTDLLYLTFGLLTSILGFAVWVSALSASLSLAVFLVGLPVMLLSAWAFHWVAQLDRRNAALVEGRVLRGRYRDHTGKPFLARLRGTLADGQTWRDLAWLVLHSIIGFGFGVAAICLVGTVIGVAFLPVWYWAVPDGIDYGLWTVDTLGEAFATALLALPAAALTVGLLRAMALGESRLAVGLLDSGRQTS
jgi:hypothetical protein